MIILNSPTIKQVLIFLNYISHTQPTLTIHASPRSVLHFLTFIIYTTGKR